MIRMDVTVDEDVLDAIRDAAEEAPRRMKKAYARRIKSIRQRMLDDLRRYPGPVKYPFRWKSERQRRAFFATDGFGHGIPYVRTNALKDGWTTRIRDTTDGAIFEVENTADYARYVVGDDQQPGHLATGWQSAGAIVAKYREQATDELIDTWGAVALGEDG
jgi:hypothetical protein